MISSKMKTLSMVLPLFASLIACSPDSKRAKNPNFGNVANFDRAEGTNFLVDSATVTSSSVVSYTAYGWPKAKLFNFKACVKDAGSAGILEGSRFQIKDHAGGSVRLTVPMDGCLYWTETHEYSVLSDEKFFLLKRTIAAEAPYRGSVEVKMAFNPWADGSAAIKDVRYTRLGPNEPLVDIGPISMNGKSSAGILSQQGRPDLNLNVDSLSLDFQGIDLSNYELNNLLGLTVAHKYQVRVKPSALRKTMSKVIQPESFVGGKMKAYIALFRESQEVSTQYTEKNLVFSTEFILEDVKRVGTFYADNLVVKFDRLADLTSRTTALVTLIPFEGKEQLGELSFSGIMRPGRLSTMSLVPSSIGARQFFELDQLRKQKRSNAIDMIVAERGLTPLDRTPVQIDGFWSDREVDVDAEVKSLLARKDLKTGSISKAISKDLKKALCHKIHPTDNARTVYCQAGAQNYLQVELRDFVDSIASRPRLVSQPLVHRLNTTISYGLNEASGSSQGFSGSIRPSISFDPLAILNKGLQTVTGGMLGIRMSIGGEYYTIRDYKWSETTSSSATVSASVEVTAEGNTFQFDADVKRCLIATSSTESRRIPGTSDSEPTAPISVFACQETAQRQVRTETFYLIGQSLGNAGSPFSDPEAAAGTNWRMMVRGKQNALVLFEFLKKSELNLNLDKIPDAAMQGPLSKEFNTIQDYPGMLSL